MLILPSDVVRFKAKIAVADNGCWEWTSTSHRGGYGRMWLHGGQVLAHRFSYQLHVGPITPGFTIDHLCRNTKCVNPAHLEQMSLADNVRRGINNAWARKKRRTHCIHGHEFTESNTAIRVNGTRLCKECNKQKQQRYRDAKKAV